MRGPETRERYETRCPVRSLLAGALFQCHAAVMSLGDQQLQATATGDPHAHTQAKTLLRSAMLGRDASLVALKEHTAKHDCV